MERSRQRSGTITADPFAGAWQAGEEIDRALSTIQNVYKYGSFADHDQDPNHPQALWTAQPLPKPLTSDKPVAKEQKPKGRNIPFSRYTPNPYYNALTNDLIQETYINLDVDYINSAGDISITSCSSCSTESKTTCDPLDDRDRDLEDDDSCDSLDSHRRLLPHNRHRQGHHRGNYRPNRGGIGGGLRDRWNQWNRQRIQDRKRRERLHDDVSALSSDSNFLLNDSSSNWSFQSSKDNSPASYSSSTMSQVSDTDETITSFIELDHPLLGMIFVVIAALLYATLNLSVKTLMYETPWQELMFVRMALTWIITTIWMLVQFRGGMNLFGPDNNRIRMLMLLRAICLWGAVLSCWWSFEFLPVGM